MKYLKYFEFFMELKFHTIGFYKNMAIKTLAYDLKKIRALTQDLEKIRTRPTKFTYDLLQFHDMIILYNYDNICVTYYN